MNAQLVPETGGPAIPITKRHVIVGRRSDSDIVLSFPEISGHHCEIFVEDDSWFIRDLNSRNGVRVNNVKIGKRQEPIQFGNRLSFAHHRYEFKEGD